MKLHLADNQDLLLVQAYDDGAITVRKQRYQSSLILTPQRIIPDWRPQLLAELTAADLQQTLETEPEVVLLGTGRRLQFPDGEVFSAIHAARVGVEVMDTPAACRTYNILAGEGRQVVAALLFPGH